MFDDPLFQNPPLLILLGTVVLFTIGAGIMVYLDERTRKKELRDKNRSSRAAD